MTRLICLFGVLFCIAACTPLRVLTTNPETPKSEDAAIEAPSGSYKLDTDHAFVLFKVSHFGFSNYIGQFDRFTALLDFDADQPTKSRLEVVIDTRSIKTGNAELEGMLRAPSVFDVADHPEATFISTRIDRTGPSTGRVVGDLTIKGKTHPAILNVRFNGADANPFSGNPTLGFSANGEIDRSDWGISNWVPAVARRVELEIEAEFFLEN